MRTTPRLSSKARHNDISDTIILTWFSSNVESLKKGILNVSKNNAKSSYTILLVGETGVGKSSVLEYIANVLIGRDVDHYDFEILDHTVEQGGSDDQSQTRFYELRSNNGLVVCASVSGD